MVVGQRKLSSSSLCLIKRENRRLYRRNMCFSCIRIIFCVVLVAQSCLTLCNPLDYSPPGSSVHEILQARILERVAIPFSKGSSQPRDQTEVSCIAGRFFTI